MNREGTLFHLNDDQIRLSRDYLLTLRNQGLISLYHNTTASPMVPITYRSVTSYFFRFPALNELATENVQIVEVGAGLSEYVPYVSTKTSKKPIVIDPVDYNELRTLLTYAYDIVPVQYKYLLVALIERCRIYLNPTKVTHYEMTIEEAIQQHRELGGIGDVVIDYMGALMYSPIGKREEMKQYEYRLIRQGVPPSIYCSIP